MAARQLPRRPPAARRARPRSPPPGALVSLPLVLPRAAEHPCAPAAAPRSAARCRAVPWPHLLPRQGEAGAGSARPASAGDLLGAQWIGLQKLFILEGAV